MQVTFRNFAYFSDEEMDSDEEVVNSAPGKKVKLIKNVITIEI